MVRGQAPGGGTSAPRRLFLERRASAALGAAASLGPVAGGAVVALGVAAVQLWLEQSLYSQAHVSGWLLVAGVIGLWLGHRNEPGLRPLINDLQLMMIGPAWLLSALYRRLGIPF